MRRFAQAVVFLSAAFLPATQPKVHAQTAVPQTQTGRFCPTPAAADEPPPGPEITVVDVNFVGSLQMPTADQEKIAGSVKQLSGGHSTLDQLTDEAAGRVREEWQNHGYFAVETGGEARTLTRNSISQRVALNFHVDEGPQYNLGGIAFKHNKVISDVGTLRLLFPIQDGDIFNREAIVTGMDNLRSTYQEMGYFNFVSVPNTTVDAEKKLVFMDVDLDEGKLFRFSDLEILAPDEPRRQELQNAFPMKPGQVYVESLVESFLWDYSIAPDDPALFQRHLDERAATVAVRLDVRPCAN